jgi:hypothetical protein
MILHDTHMWLWLLHQPNQLSILGTNCYSGVSLRDYIPKSMSGGQPEEITISIGVTLK